MLNKSSVNFNSVANNKIYLKTDLHSKKSNPNNKIKKMNMKNYSSSLNIESLNHMKVIGQFDRKFLLMINYKDNTIILFDQHAIHERILYEFYSQLLKDELIIHPVLKKSENNLSKYNLLTNIYTKQFLKIPIEISKDKVDINNLIFQFDNSRLNNLFNFEFIIKRDKVLIYTAPIVLDRVLDQEECKELFLKLLFNIRKLVIIDESGVSSIDENNINLIFDMFRGVVKSRACRDSVKFNEELDNQFIMSLFSNLRKCQNPFLCAHGRHNFFLLVEKKKD